MGQMRAMARKGAAVVVLVVFLVAACGGGKTTRYRLPLENAGDPETSACIQGCRSKHPHTDASFAMVRGP